MYFAQLSCTCIHRYVHIYVRTYIQKYIDIDLDLDVDLALRIVTDADSGLGMAHICRHRGCSV